MNLKLLLKNKVYIKKDDPLGRYGKTFELLFLYIIIYKRINEMKCTNM